jgi:alpha/beta hydrolase family protein
MGGRIASHLAAAGDEARGLVLLGYPLHSPKQPEKLRTAHLPRLSLPTLIVQGNRDPFGTPDELRVHFSPATELAELPGAPPTTKRRGPTRTRSSPSSSAAERRRATSGAAHGAYGSPLRAPLASARSICLATDLSDSKMPLPVAESASTIG